MPPSVQYQWSPLLLAVPKAVAARIRHHQMTEELRACLAAPNLRSPAYSLLRSLSRQTVDRRHVPLSYRVTVVNTRHSSYIPPPPLVCACEYDASLRNNFAVPLKKCGGGFTALALLLVVGIQGAPSSAMQKLPPLVLLYFFLASPLFRLILSGRFPCVLVLYRYVYK